ncbi:nuclease-related domain-containing protein [Thermomonospora catenispora]|uniref:nuclease-related domain-containing protein n=1 Tax=Thermomonospora catenispora TaxID=2493090 RepID=UPI00111E75D9|nr:nuclease-related domain-containing protein [Thermomonospora catenispora]TNY35269.1 NERD domain-containing protein [Thermomonospora catenispora]
MPGGRAGGGEASRAGASAWARYQAIAAEYRRERIMVRLALAGAVAVIGLGVAEWRAGLAAGGTVFVAHLLYDRHRPGPASSWRRGALAERRTGRKLARLGRGYRVLHDLALPGGATTNVDHLVIGRTGVYAVINRRWRLGTRLWSDERRLWAGAEPVAALPATARRIARIVGELLSDEMRYTVPVRPVVAVHGVRMRRDGLRHRGVDFQRAARLPYFIAERPEVFTGAEVAAIALAAERILPPMADILVKRRVRARR